MYEQEISCAYGGIASQSLWGGAEYGDVGRCLALPSRVAMQMPQACLGHVANCRGRCTVQWSGGHGRPMVLQMHATTVVLVVLLVWQGRVDREHGW